MSEWPKAQSESLKRLLDHLADEVRKADLATMYAPTDWAAGRYAALVRHLHWQAETARSDGPEPEHVPDPDPEADGGVIVIQLGAEAKRRALAAQYARGLEHGEFIREKVRREKVRRDGASRPSDPKKAAHVGLERDKTRYP